MFIRQIKFLAVLQVIKTMLHNFLAKKSVSKAHNVRWLTDKEFVKLGYLLNHSQKKQNNFGVSPWAKNIIVYDPKNDKPYIKNLLYLYNPNTSLWYLLCQNKFTLTNGIKDILTLIASIKVKAKNYQERNRLLLCHL